jgi:hypothetical protein
MLANIHFAHCTATLFPQMSSDMAPNSKARSMDNETSWLSWQMLAAVGRELPASVSTLIALERSGLRALSQLERHP